MRQIIRVCYYLESPNAGIAVIAGDFVPAVHVLPHLCDDALDGEDDQYPKVLVRKFTAAVSRA